MRAELTVQDLCRDLPDAVIRDLVEPLCVAALNTPMATASGRVFLRVLKDALFAGPGSADLLLPRVPLSYLLPDAATEWLGAQGATINRGRRVMTIGPTETAGRSTAKSSTPWCSRPQPPRPHGSQHDQSRLEPCGRVTSL